MKKCASWQRFDVDGECYGREEGREKGTEFWENIDSRYLKYPHWYILITQNDIVQKIEILGSSRNVEEKGLSREKTLIAARYPYSYC